MTLECEDKTLKSYYSMMSIKTDLRGGRGGGGGGGGGGNEVKSQNLNIICTNAKQDTRHYKSIHSPFWGIGFEIVSPNRSALILLWNLSISNLQDSCVARRVWQNNSEDTNFLEQKEVFTQYLLDQGYHSSLIDNAFNKLSDLANGNNDQTTCLISMVMNQNSALRMQGAMSAVNAMFVSTISCPLFSI